MLSAEEKSYGPGTEYRINTLKPFNVEQKYHEKDRKFTGYTTVMTQGDQVLIINKQNCSYLKDMSDDMT